MIRMNLDTLLPAIAAAFIYGISGYIKSEFPELSVNNFNLEAFLKKFSFTKLGATIILSLIIGIVMAYTNNPVTQVGFEAQLAVYFIYLVPIENILKALYRYKNKIIKLT